MYTPVQCLGRAGAGSVDPGCYDRDESCQTDPVHVQVERLAADVLARVLPEGVKL